MRHLGWLAAVLPFTVLAAAVTSAGRVILGLLRGRRGYRDVDLTHAALMGASMAGMFVAGPSFLSVAIWQDVFTVVLAWHAIRAIAGSQNRNGKLQGLLFQTGHLMSIAAMLYMLRSASSAITGAMNGPDAHVHGFTRRSGERVPAGALVLDRCAACRERGVGHQSS